MYRTVMGPTYSIHPTLCPDCIQEKIEYGTEKVEVMDDSFGNCDVCGEESWEADEIISKVSKSISKESFEAAANWGWTR